VVLTASGAQFITPLTLQTLSKNPVHTDLFDLLSESEIGHIALAQRAHLLLIAPATANILGKIRNGIADDLLSTIVMATAAPVLMAPAMNSQMYASPAVRENAEVLRERGVTFVDPDEGELACGTVGPGRLADTAKIVEMARILLAEKILAGKKVVVSAGPTAEDIDLGGGAVSPAGPPVPQDRAGALRAGDDGGGSRGGGRGGRGGHGRGGGRLPPGALRRPEDQEGAVRPDREACPDGRYPRLPRPLEGKPGPHRLRRGDERPRRERGGEDAAQEPRRHRGERRLPPADSNEVRVYFSDGTAIDLAIAAKDAIASAVWRAVRRKFLPG
jgi:hypothetical protein